CAQVIDVLHKARGAKRVGLVEDLVTDAAAFGQTALCKLHAKPCHAVLGHEYDGTVVLELVRDVLALEVLHDRGGVLIGQVGEQRRQLRRGNAQHENAEERHQRNRHGAHSGKPRRAQRSQKTEECLHENPTYNVGLAEVRPGKICLVRSYRPVNVRAGKAGARPDLVELYSMTSAILRSLGSTRTTLF